MIADAQLVATQPPPLGGAQIALMNPGGVRADLFRSTISGGEAIGQITYGEAFNVQPFGNSLVTKTMTGDMLRRLLQQQFAIQVNPLPAPATPCLGGTVTVSDRSSRLAGLLDLQVRVGAQRADVRGQSRPHVCERGSRINRRTRSG